MDSTQQGTSVNTNYKALDFLHEIVNVLEYQEKPSICNQGQCLDGFSALANYNELAREIRDYINGR